MWTEISNHPRPFLFRIGLDKRPAVTEPEVAGFINPR